MITFTFIHNNAQDLFDAACKHLLRMPRRCHSGFSCRYLIRETGERCVVGAVIDTPTAAHEIELARLAGGVEGNIAEQIFEPLSQKGIDVLVRLQGFHDSDVWWHERTGFTAPAALVEMAKEMGLSTDKLDGYIEERQERLANR